MNTILYMHTVIYIIIPFHLPMVSSSASTVHIVHYSIGSSLGSRA